MTNLNFIPQNEIELLAKLTRMDQEDVLGDYLLFCDMAELTISMESWTEYKDETENQF
jgi:hypothetical protein